MINEENPFSEFLDIISQCFQDKTDAVVLHLADTFEYYACGSINSEDQFNDNVNLMYSICVEPILQNARVPINGPVWRDETYEPTT